MSDSKIHEDKFQSMFSPPEAGLLWSQVIREFYDLLFTEEIHKYDTEFIQKYLKNAGSIIGRIYFGVTDEMRQYFKKSVKEQFKLDIEIMNDKDFEIAHEEAKKNEGKSSTNVMVH